MPELPEVESVVRSLRPALVGRVMVRVDHVRGDMLRPACLDFARRVTGRVFQQVHRQAKRICFTLDQPVGRVAFYVHLGMTGQLRVCPARAAVQKHTHLVVQLDDDSHLRLVDPRRFGAIGWIGDGDATALGPEPLTIRPTQLHGLLMRTRRAVKTALLDQRLIAGIGNIYADESLHRAGLHPQTPAAELTLEQTHRLCRAMRQVLRQAIRAGGSTLRDYVDATGRPGTAQRLHRVYAREGNPCATCGGRIVRIVLGGRSSHFCPVCQPDAS